ncbi:MAG TPA: DUF4349 domain-containing protein [Terracidiphilus sp.]|jgi:hypothetical protein
MNTLTHTVAPEEIMALLDGELTGAEAGKVTAHIDECSECAALRDELRGTSEALRAWTIPAASAEMEQAVAEQMDRIAATTPSARPHRYTPLSFRNWRLWAIGGGGAFVTLVLLVGLVATANYRSVSLYKAVEPQDRTEISAFGTSAPQVSASAPLPNPSQAGTGGGAYYDDAPSDAASKETNALPARSMTDLARPQPGVVAGVSSPPPPSPAPASGPMIARTVSMTILVKNIAESRAALDRILAQHRGYAAQLTVNTPENGARSFQSSLRIPAGDLNAALDALRSLGRVQTETQSGEEVTQQHADLIARLTNARETEARLRAILQQRTGKMEDVLDVEEKISETRGEIEQMEAEQKELEHRVDFAGIDLTLVEEYKAQLGGSAPSVGNAMGNAFVAGLRHAGGSLLGLILFAEEYGPVLLMWAAILGIPTVLVWRYLRSNRR